MKRDFMDSKLRGKYKMKVNRDSLTIPHNLIDIINDCETPECIITIAPQCLLVYPLGSWKEYEILLLSQEPEDPDEDTVYQELLHAQQMFSSKPTQIDSGGRLKLTARHFAYLNQPKEVVITGHGDHLEVRTVEEYDDKFNKFTQSEFFKGPEKIRKRLEVKRDE